MLLLRQTKNVICLGNVRKMSTSTEEIEWKLRNYKYFLPVQLRRSDFDGNGQFKSSCALMLGIGLHLRYTQRYYGSFVPKNAMTVSVEGTLKHNTELLLRYSETPLAAIGVRKLGNSSVLYRGALFKPKRFSKENNDSLGLFLQEKFFDESERECAEKYFESTASTLVYANNVIVDKSSHKPVQDLPLMFRETLQKVMLGTD
ncbi:unnamed protein product [Clavelina lepadiformis]|uniref:Ribosomal protein L5 n=1 Tax=Clavelina lepadiformis TaxID=159417 RepID=A0ABP0GQQ6_CLALP